MFGSLSAGRADRLFLALVLAAVAARLLMVWLLPPLLDVYYYDSQAVKALLSGLDPYGLSYTGIPSWLATPEATNVFAYLPGVLLFLAPFGALLDVRVGLVAADVLVGFGVYLIGGGRAKSGTLIFLLLPFTALFSTSYPNNTLVAMAFFGPSVALWLRGKNGIASILFGAALASSQFLWLLFPLFIGWALGSRRLRGLAVAIAVALALMLPFLLWNASAFTFDTLFFEFTRAPRPILSAAAFGVNVNPTLDGIAATLFGVSVPFLFRAAATLAALAYATVRSRDLSTALLNSTWFMVVTAFVLPNDISWWYLELPFQTLLMWFVAKGAKSAPTPVNT